MTKFTSSAILSILHVKVVSGSSFSTPVNVAKVCCKNFVPSSFNTSSPASVDEPSVPLSEFTKLVTVNELTSNISPIVGAVSKVRVVPLTV